MKCVRKNKVYLVFCVNTTNYFHLFYLHRIYNKPNRKIVGNLNF